MLLTTSARLAHEHQYGAASRERLIQAFPELPNLFITANKDSAGETVEGIDLQLDLLA